SAPVLCPHSQHGLVHELEMDAGAVARHGAIERWLAMQEVDRETERVLEKRGRCFHVGHEDHRHRAREPKCRRCGSGLRGPVSLRNLQRRPTRVASLERDDLLRLAKWELEGERLTISQRLVAGETTNPPTDRIVALAMPANELFCLLLVDVETRH